MTATNAMEELVDHPAHYESGGIPTIEVVEAAVDGIGGKQAFFLGNVLKYALRAGKKGDAATDLAKANNFAHRLCTGEWRWQHGNERRAHMGDDPARAYDLHVEAMERAYEERTADATCGDCAKCREPDGEYENPGRIAWCKHMGEFVRSTDSPGEYDCEAFE